MNKTMLLAGLLSGFAFSTIHAAQTPHSAGFDNRVQRTAYNPENVVTIRTKVGEAMLIQLQEGETVSAQDMNSGLGMGFGKAWGLSIRGNNLFLKPTKPNPATNLLFTTTKKRTYIFEIRLAGPKQIPTYVLRFDYPDDRHSARQQQLDKETRAANVLRTSRTRYRKATGYNRNYWGRGDRTLVPTEIFDDGRFTYFRYDNAGSLPAVFRINADGSEAAVNSHIENDTLVVHETAGNFVLRLGKSVLGIENRSYDGKGIFNDTGSSQKNTVRLKKEAKND